MAQKFAVILLTSLFLLSGCALQNQTSEITPENKSQNNESKMSKQQAEDLFLENGNDKHILESFIVDFDMDGKEDCVILFADIGEKSYSNIAVVSQNGAISEVGLDASKEFRFVEPIQANILKKGDTQPELVVRLQSTKDGAVLEYNVTMNRSADKKETSFKISSKKV